MGPTHLFYLLVIFSLTQAKPYGMTDGDMMNNDEFTSIDQPSERSEIGESSSDKAHSESTQNVNKDTKKLEESENAEPSVDNASADDSDIDAEEDINEKNADKADNTVKEEKVITKEDDSEAQDLGKNHKGNTEGKAETFKEEEEEEEVPDQDADDDDDETELKEEKASRAKPRCGCGCGYGYGKVYQNILFPMN